MGDVVVGYEGYEGVRITHEKPFDEIVPEFCRAVSSSIDVAELEAVDIIDDYLYPNTDISRKGGMPTLRVRRALNILEADGGLMRTEQLLHDERVSALSMFMRGVIQGGEVPTERFSWTLAAAHAGLYRLECPKKEIHDKQRKHSLEIWRNSLQWNNVEKARRAAEAYRPIGTPLRYGYMMARIERVQRSQR